MVATHIEEIKHSMLCVTGVYFRDITHFLKFFFFSRGSMCKICCSVWWLELKTIKTYSFWTGMCTSPACTPVMNMNFFCFESFVTFYCRSDLIKLFSLWAGMAQSLPQQQAQPGGMYSGPSQQPAQQPAPGQPQYMGAVPPNQYPSNLSNNQMPPQPQGQQASPQVQQQLPPQQQQQRPQESILDAQLISFD